MMIIGGLAELAFGLKAERQSLESIAAPLTAADTKSGSAPGAHAPAEAPATA